MSRRWVLRGTGGVALGLPLLESLLPRNAFAQAGSRPRFAVFMRQANGVAQESGGEPERFFPRALGPITTASLSTTDADRAVSELKDYAGKLLIVRGLRFGFPGNG
ncbi:MAG TPA: hypothetical protein VEY30_10700, partial [Myxococcaceae bacterium]|nr:hypothetical protein [Myxococcaceae bacterium]